MMELIGRQGNVVLFSSGDGMGVLVDEDSNRVLAVDSFDTLVASGVYEETTGTARSSLDLADAALTTLNINVIPTTDRMHTIPKAVQTEARRSLDWHAKHGRGGTPVGLHTASILAEGGQIGIKKIRHIAQYFPRHAMDASCQGYAPKDEGYPNKGRISWGLRGGDAAQRWATGVVERENRKQGLSIVASNGYYDHEKPLPVSIESFTEPDPEFAARVRTDGGGIDRLYKIETDGSVSIWDDGCWDDLGNIDHDIATYDRALDDAYDKSEKYYVPIDRQAAITLAALFDADPFGGKDPYSLDSDEADLILAAADQIDWNEIDSITAAGVPDDGKYTPQERSDNVKAQVRDRSGRFAESGSNIIIGGDSKKKGKILSIDGATKKAKVKMADGRTIDVPVNLTEKDEDPAGSTEESSTPEAIDTTGILGEERKPQDKGIARLPKDLPVLSPDEVKDFLRDYPSHVADSRSAKKDKPVTAAGADQSNDTEQPAGSDIKPINMAIVAEDDPQAVLELVSLIPANANSTTPITFKRKPGVWERDDSILADLNSPTPPPVVMLDDETLNTVMQQIDAAAEEDSAPAPAPAPATPVTAAGGLDRNRGNAEKLRRYWLYGEGAAKIRWNTGGDWKRCVKQLAKHLGPRAKGYCALRHKEATGMWTGDQKHRQMYGRTASGETYSNDFILSTNEIIQSAITRARVADARRRVLTAGAPPEGQGAAFCIPLLLPEEIESGDGRKFNKGSLDMRDLPLPLLWQIKTGSGHDGSVVVGKMESMERVEGGIGNVHGHFDTGEFGREAERLVRLGFFRGVSADLDMFEADVEVEDAKDATTGEDTKVETGRMSISKGRIMAATIVAKPAFQEVTIHIVDPEGLQESQQEEDVVPDGVYVEDVDALEASALVACGIVAGVIPVAPPAEWFDNPKLKSATPLTVGDDGRVYGHIAAWHVDHIGMSFGTRPPKSRSNYAYFHTGVVRTDEGTDMPVGQLTLAGGHASLEMSAQEAVRHYDDTASAIADVHAGEDAYGIWVSGALRPGTTPEQIRALRASAPSGDWRPIKGRLELVGVLQVNVPGFPIARSRVASGQVMALVAAGASTLARMKHDPVSELNARVARLEQEAAAPALTAAALDARARMENMTAQIMDKRRAELSARVGQRKRELSSDDDSKESHPSAELSLWDRIEQIKTLLPADAELSIRDRIAAVEASIMNNSGDLETSSASEFSKAKDPLDDLTPEQIDALKQEKVSRENEKARADKAPEIPLDKNGEPLAPGVQPEGLKVTPQAKGKYTAETQPRDAQGQFRLVLARLKSDIGDAGLDRLLKKVEDTENLDHAGDYAGAVGASQELLETIDRLDSGALDATAIGNVRKTAGELGKVIANLPFNFENQAAKIRFSDVPPTLRDLMEQMIKRVEAKIGSKDAAVATQGLKSFMSGSDVMSQSDISTEMSKLLRLLT